MYQSTDFSMQLWVSDTIIKMIVHYAIYKDSWVKALKDGEIVPLQSRHIPHCVFSVAQSCPTLCNPMGCRLLGSSVHGMSQARILEWVAISSSMGSS